MRASGKMVSFFRSRLVGKERKHRDIVILSRITLEGISSRAHLVQSQEFLRGHAATIALLDILPFLLLALPLLLVVLLRGLLHKVEHLLTR